MRLVTLIAIVAAHSAAAQTPVERDSAGIHIVENPSRAKAPVVFRLGTKTVDLGGPANNLDDEFNPRMLGSFRGVRMSDGSLAVINSVRMQFYDARGQQTGSFGRVGAGPQEFRSLNGTEFCRTRGDTLVAGDYRNGRIAIIHQRSVIKTTPLGAEFGGGVAGCFDDGTMLMQGGMPNARTPTYTVRLNRIRLDGTLANSLGTIEFRTPSFVTGYIFPTVRASGQRVYAGDGATSEVRVYRADGRLVQIIRSADTAQRVTPADVELVLSRSPQVRDQWRPETFPIYSRFLVDPDGRLWVCDDVPPRRSSDRESWTAFDMNGRSIGRLEVPRKMGTKSVSVLAFGVNEVQLTERDEDGFYHLAFYPLVRDAR